MKQPRDEWFGAGIRFGLVLTLGLCLVAMMPGSVARSQAVNTTTVQGTVYLANGQVGAGTVNVSWPAFSTASGQSIAAGHETVTIAADGYLSVNLAPNLGSTPAGLYYTAIYQLSNATTSTQYWVVPAAAQVTLAQVQSQLMPAAQAVQAVSKAYVDQSIAELTGSLLTASGGTLSGNLYLNADPTQSLQAADKHYVDSTFNLEVPIAGGTMTGPLQLSGDPTQPLQASDKKYVDTQLSLALPITGGAVAGELTGKQIGAVYQVDQFPGTDFGAKVQSCLELLSQSYGGTCDARNFAGTLAMGTNLTISTGNATVLLPCATIATASQVIVTAGTRNVTLKGCAMRGASTASGSEGGTVFLYSGPSAFVQVGDPTYAADTSGFHLDNAVINTTAAPSASAQGLAAYRTQELDIASLYFLGNSNQTGMTLDGTGNYTGGSFYGDQFDGFQTAVNAIGHRVANPATTDWMNASTFVRLHIDCPTSGGNPISGTYGINLQQGDGNTFTGGDVESCGTALHLGPNAQNNTIVGLRNENSTNQVAADAGSSYNNWMTGGTMFTGKLTDSGTRNSFLDSFHRTFNGMNGDWYGSQQDATVTNHWRLGIGTGNERGLLNEIQTDYGYRWVEGYTDATGGEQYYQVQDLLNNVTRLSLGQYNTGQASTNNQTVLNAAGTGAVVLNGSNNSGTGGVVFGSGGASETTVATIDKAGDAQFSGSLQVMGLSTLMGTPTVKNQADAEIDAVLWAGLTQSQKESLVYRDYGGNSEWYAEKDASNNWELNSATGGLDSFKAYQSTNSGDTYINASNGTGHIRLNYEPGSGSETDVYAGGALIAKFSGLSAIEFPGLATANGYGCAQLDGSGWLTNSGSPCSTASGTVGSGNANQIAYYTSNGTAISGMSMVPVNAGGTGALTSAGALANLGGVATTTMVNGHALAGNVTVSASDLTIGTLPHAQLPALVSGDIPANSSNTTGTAGNVTATSNSTLSSLPLLALPYSQLTGTMPLWNQNTTGNSSNVTGNVALTNGGTGATTATGALSNLGALPLTGGALTGALSGTGASFSGALASGTSVCGKQVGTDFYVDCAPNSCTTNEGSFSDQTACAFYAAFDLACTSYNSTTVHFGARQYGTSAQLNEPECVSSSGMSAPAVNLTGAGVGYDVHGVLVDGTGLTATALQPYLLYKLGTYYSPVNISGIGFHGNGNVQSTVYLNQIGQNCNLDQISVDGAIGTGYNSAQGYLGGSQCNIGAIYAIDPVSNTPSLTPMMAKFSVSISGGVPTISFLSSCQSNGYSSGGVSTCGGNYRHTGSVPLVLLGIATSSHLDGAACLDPGSYWMTITGTTGSGIVVIRAASGCPGVLTAQASDIAPTQNGWYINVGDTHVKSVQTVAYGAPVYFQGASSSCNIPTSTSATINFSSTVGSIGIGQSLFIPGSTLTGSCGSDGLNGNNTLTVTSVGTNTITVSSTVALTNLSNTSTTGSIVDFEWGCGIKLASAVWGFVHPNASLCGIRTMGAPDIEYADLDSNIAYAMILDGQTILEASRQTWAGNLASTAGAQGIYVERSGWASSINNGECGNLQSGGQYALFPVGNSGNAQNGNDSFYPLTIHNMAECDNGNSVTDQNPNSDLHTILMSTLGTAMAASNLTAGSGWFGATELAGYNVSGVSGYSQRFAFTITAAGTPTANSTFTATLANTFPASPICEARQSGGTGAINFVIGGAAASTTSTGTFTWQGTPVAGQTYQFTVDCR